MITRNRPYFDLSEILAALRPGQGRSEFESIVADRLSVRYALAFAYGHAGFIASLRALGLTGTDIVLPAFTCSVMADAVVASDNRPVFVDIDLADYNMSLDAMKAALTPQTRVIVATHMYGYPVNVDAIREASGGDQVLIVEDRALGFLTYSPGTVSLRGDLGLFSFGKGKHLSSVEGGVIVTNSADLYAKIKAYRDRNMARLPAILWLRRWVRFFLSCFPFGKSISPYELRQEVQRAFSSVRGLDRPQFEQSMVARDADIRYADFQARIGLCQLGKLDTILERRRKWAEFYDRELRDIPGLTPAPIIPGATYSYYTARVERRDEIGFVQHMHNRGVDVGYGYGYVLPFRERFRPYAKGRYPNTEQATRQVVNLPIHPKIKMSEAQYVVECIRDILQQSNIRRIK